MLEILLLKDLFQNAINVFQKFYYKNLIP